jgi:N-formylglutamate deformylase
MELHLPQQPIFMVQKPLMAAIPLILDSPHSGVVEPADFAYACAKAELQKGVDWWVDALVQGVCSMGGTLLAAQITRSYIDLNRSLAEFDPDLCADTWPHPLAQSPRVRFGMGLLRSKVRPDAPVYNRKLSRAEIRHRIDHYYTPYYAVLRDLLDAAFDAHGQVLHLNCHSTPSILLNGQALPDVIVGDRDGQTCGRAWRDVVVKYLRKQGLTVAVNNPYKGVELVRRFANPKIGRHSLQLEINKKLYMCEQSFEKRPHHYAQLQAVLNGLWGHLGAELTAKNDAKIAAE